jgi:hypothetical protein
MAIDKIGSKALVDCSVAAADIAPGTITDAKLAGSIANAKLANTTVTINGTAIALGASASINPVSWQSVVVSDGSTVTTMVAGRGYFVNNTSAAGIVKLPTSASAGDTIAIKDYAGNFATNKLTIQRNSHNIQGVANDSEISTNRASVQLVYIDATKGWLYTNESNVADLQQVLHVAATGGTVATSGNFKIHSFTGDGCFVVSCGGNSAGSNLVDYLVVAGGGGGGGQGGGGAGGHRTTFPSPNCNAGDFPVSAQTYPITVGGGGAASSNVGPGNCNAGSGANSVFSTITSTGGGGGSHGVGNVAAASGGSGGGGGYAGSAGSGNTPPVTPPQGNNGGTGASAGYSDARGGGGGGAGAVGSNTPGTAGGAGGNGSPNSITGSDTTRAGGGGAGGDARPGPIAPSGRPGGSGGSGGGGAGAGGGSNPGGTAGSANTGGGGGAAGYGPGYNTGANGGKGIVIIRYKYQ